MIGQYLPNKTKMILFIGLKFFQHLNVASMLTVRCAWIQGRTVRAACCMLNLSVQSVSIISMEE
jgi:hypothetical protein